MPYPPITWHPVLDSTNAAALRALDGDAPLPHGWAVAAYSQTAGRGQRGRAWDDASGKSLLLSVVVQPAAGLDQQPLFSFAVATAVAKTLDNLHPGLSLSLKWPNDLIIDDKKLGGILIENVLRGARWAHSVIGIGINVGHTDFPDHLARATSLRLATGKDLSLFQTAEAVRTAIADAAGQAPPDDVLSAYNIRLYRRGMGQIFRTGERVWNGTVEDALADGRLRVRADNGHPVICTHGVDEWVPLGH
jgi:BirA family biotin operon repressor/biotin-[acetyl-CoA-carboxylase] ligase